MELLEQAEKVLFQYFSFPHFRPQQEEIVLSLLRKENTLAILPTGGGKSICFQVPALIFPGTSIIISPLISLMTDQVEHLLENKIPATFINSHLPPEEKFKRLQKLADGEYKLFYLAPESLANQKLIAICQNIEIPMLVVDEAHCASIWGHQFRPSYKKIPEFLKKIKTNQKEIFKAAFTATATPRVEKEILEILDMESARVFSGNFLRDNLFFENIFCQNTFQKDLLLLKIIQEFQKEATIIYCSTRKACQALLQFLQEYDFRKQLRAAIYHGGMEKEDRAKVQKAFLTNELNLIIATNAFGMGVDKANINLIVHYQISASLENYYQEAGRAGRDGAESRCFLLYQQKDLLIQQQLIEHSYQLEKDLPKEKLKELEKRKKIEIEKLFIIKNYALSPTCLELKIIQYFSKKRETQSSCHHCANCLGKTLHLQEEEQLLFEQLEILNQHYFHTVDCQSPPILLPIQSIEALMVLKPQNYSQLSKVPGIGSLILDNEKLYRPIIEMMRPQ